MAKAKSKDTATITVNVEGLPQVRALARLLATAVLALGKIDTDEATGLQRRQIARRALTRIQKEGAKIL